jgi:hypothetical protein
MLKRRLLLITTALCLTMPALAADMSDTERLKLIQGELEYLIRTLGGPDSVTMARKAAGFEPGAVAATPAAQPAPALAAASAPSAQAPADDTRYKAGWVVTAAPPGHFENNVGRFEVPVNDGAIDSRSYIKKLNITDLLAMTYEGFFQATESGRYTFRLDITPTANLGNESCEVMAKINDVIVINRVNAYTASGGSAIGGFDVGNPGLLKTQLLIYCDSPLFPDRVKSATIKLQVKSPSDDMLRALKETEILHKVAK